MEQHSSFSPRLLSLLALLFLSMLILFSVTGKQEETRLSSPRALSLLPQLRAEAYLVRFAEDDVMPLASRRAGKRLAPASLTKIMTALVARALLAADERIVFSQDAKNVEEHQSDAAAGEVFSRDDTVRMALMASANDAALALAEAVGKKFGRIGFADRVGFFVQSMNRSAEALGLRDTHFENPVGLDAAGHATSAADLARLVAYTLRRDPELLAMTRDLSREVFSMQSKRHTITSTNELLKEFPALRGGKTGFTDEAKGALMLLYPVKGFVRGSSPAEGETAIIVILKSEDRFGDGRKIIAWLEANCFAHAGDSGERPCEP